MNELRAEHGATQIERSLAILNIDPPDHTRIRKLVAKAFTPRAVERIRASAAQQVDAILDGLAERDEPIDLIGELAFPLPFAVINEMKAKARAAQQDVVDLGMGNPDGATPQVVVDKLIEAKALAGDPIRTQVAAVSCGVFQGAAVLDLDYDEDSTAGCDGNFVLTADGSIVEAQVTAEGECYDEELLLRMLRLARIGCGEIFQAQLKATGR